MQRAPTGHQDSVTCTEFSHDGRYLATGDMGGGVRVWGVEDRQPVCAFDTSDLEVGSSFFIMCYLFHVYTSRVHDKTGTVPVLSCTLDVHACHSIQMT